MAAASAVALCRVMLRLSLCPDLEAEPDMVWVERRLAVMGTVLDLRVAGVDRRSALEASEAAAGEMARVEDLLSTWKPGGPLDRLNQARPGQRVPVGEEASAVLSRVFDWSRRTGRAFDPTVLPLVFAWDLRGQGRLPGRAELARALAATGLGRFGLDAVRGEAWRLSEGSGIDEGAWGKGYALDQAAAVLRRSGVREALLNLGGQLLVLGRAYAVVADPHDRFRAAAALDVVDASLSTSSNSERGLTIGRQHVGHLLDPMTGQPASDFGSATVVAPSGLTADVLSTAFFVLGPARGLALSERLRRAGLDNQVLFLVIEGDRVKAVASPGLPFHLEEP